VRTAIAHPDWRCDEVALDVEPLMHSELLARMRPATFVLSLTSAVFIDLVGKA